jgi:protein-disulfide isomerase
MVTSFLLVLALLGQQAPAECGCEAERPAVLATVDGQQIAAKDVEADAAPAIALAAQELARLRAKTVQALVTERLLDREASRLGVSRGDLVRSRVMGAAVAPTPRDVRDYYDRNEPPDGEPFAARRPRIEAFLLEQRREQAYFAFVKALRDAAKVEIVDAAPAAPATEADRARVVALVDGAPVTLGQVEDRVLPASFDLRRTIYLAEQRAIDRRIEDILLAREAARRGITTQELLDTDVGEKVHIVDAADAAAYYAAHASEFGGRPLADVRDRLIEVLQQREDDQAVDLYVAGLRSRAKVEVALVEPAPPGAALEVAGRPALGAEAPRVTIVEFSDFECPRCAAASASVRALVAAHSREVRLVARNFPLPQHVRAFRAAEAAEAAADQGKYWEFAELLYANQDALDDAGLRALAARAGLDLSRFDAALVAGRFRSRVERDVDDGTRLGIAATPTFVVNGRVVGEATEQALRRAVEEALREGAGSAATR